MKPGRTARGTRSGARAARARWRSRTRSTSGTMLSSTCSHSGVEVVVEVVDDPARAELVVAGALLRRALAVAEEVLAELGEPGSEPSGRGLLGRELVRGQLRRARDVLGLLAERVGRAPPSRARRRPCRRRRPPARTGCRTPAGPTARRAGCRRARRSARRASAAPRARARPAVRARTASPCGRPSSSTSSGMSRSASSSFLRASATGSPGAHGGGLPEVDVAHALEREPLERAVGAHEVLDERLGGVHQQLGGRRELGELAALLEDRDLVAHLDRLVDVVGDEDDRLAQLGLQAQELVLQPLAVDRVDGAERLVHQHQRRVGGERAGDADALALAAGELGRVAVAEVAGEADQLEQLLDAGAVRFLSQPSSCGTVAMLSPIVLCGNRPICWIT